MASPLPLFAFDTSKADLGNVRLCGLINCGYGSGGQKDRAPNAIAMFTGKAQCLTSSMSRISPVKCVATTKAGLSTSFVTAMEDIGKTVNYLFRTEHGDNVKVTVSKRMLKYVVFIQVPALLDCPSEGDLMLDWTIFRSEFSKIPGFQASNASDNDPVHTPFVKTRSDEFELELEFDAKKSPFHLSFLLCSSAERTRDLKIRSHRKSNFSIPVGMQAGHPAPLGASFSEDGSVNFALFSKHAESVILCLFANEKIDEPILEIGLDSYLNRTGNIWHISLESVEGYTSYGYRCNGDMLWDKGHRFHTRHVLLDPYAKVLGNFVLDNGESVSLNKCLSQLSKEPDFDWSGDVRPSLPMEELMVYRLSVRRFTEDKSSKLSEGVAGSFQGIIDKVNHIKDLGMNAILLEPITPFDEKNGPYLPYHFFSPSNLYGTTGNSFSAINSMKEMVKTLHANHMEIFLEVVFGQTAESGDASSQTISFRGIDSASYYCVHNDGALNCNNPVVQRLILDSLRHWVTEFHIDGFSFVNASSLTRGSKGEQLSCPPLIEAISFDPLLSKTKLIADFMDDFNLPYNEPPFPHWKRWAQINSGFCCDVRKFLKGEGHLSHLATRLCGSGDVFSDGRGPAFSFNFITKNSGLTLVDLVSFSSEDLSLELSWNCGEEGPTNKTAVLETRLKQIRNFIFVLYISLGVPVINMGDEFGQSTGGVPSYESRKKFDWNALRSNFGLQTTEFITFMSKLRTRRSDLLQKRNFWKSENIDWYESDLSTPNWNDTDCKFLAMMLKSEQDNMGELFIAFNAGKSSKSTKLPELPEGKSWVRLVDTALAHPGFFSLDGDPILCKTQELVTYEMKSHSCVLFETRSSSIELI